MSVTKEGEAGRERQWAYWTQQLATHRAIQHWGVALFTAAIGALTSKLLDATETGRPLDKAEHLTEWLPLIAGIGGAVFLRVNNYRASRAKRAVWAIGGIAQHRADRGLLGRLIAWIPLLAGLGGSIILEVARDRALGATTLVVVAAFMGVSVASAVLLEAWYYGTRLAEDEAVKGGNMSGEPRIASTDHTLVSYLTLRRVVGMLGVLLPVTLAVGCIVMGECAGILESISAYHGTAMRSVFAGILFTVAWFLFSYRGYDARDDLAGNAACLFALGVALCPVTSSSGLIRALHFASATALFLTLAYFSLVLFTKTGGNPTPQKLQRNKVYRVCGWIMLACIALIALYSAVAAESALAKLQPVFWLETLALWAFGVSWITKGEMLFADARMQSPREVSLRRSMPSPP